MVSLFVAQLRLGFPDCDFVCSGDYPGYVPALMGVIEELADFAEKEGQPTYTISHVQIPVQFGMPEYSGLVAYFASEEHGVLQLDQSVKIPP